jgi:hypothetical protein
MAPAAPMCQVLVLDIDNLHLDLLGLVVMIPDPGLHLIVGGQPREGALLGNLLCGLAGGVDPNRPAPAAAPLLKQVPHGGWPLTLRKGFAHVTDSPPRPDTSWG